MDFTVNEKDELVMKILHYFITERNYKPIVIHGTKNEIWLENMDDEYKIVRIVSNYIHNDEQFDFDLFKTKKIASKIKKKTLSLKVNVLNIFVDLGDNVKKVNTITDMTCLKINEVNDFKNYDKICTIYPDIDKIKYKEDGAKLFVKLTNEINKKSEKDAKEAESIFTIKKPIITYGLIGINVLIFILMYLFGDGSYNANTLLSFGACYGPYVKAGEYYRLLSSCFIHIGIVHLLLNCYALYIVGRQLESFYGKFKYLIIYLVSGIIGNIFALAFSFSYISAGASGAIFGLLGSLLYFGYHYRIYLGNVMRSQIIPIIFINLALGFVLSGVNVSAHIGGLMVGVIISIVVGVKGKTTSFEKINGFIMLVIFTFFSYYLAFMR